MSRTRIAALVLSTSIAVAGTTLVSAPAEAHDSPKHNRLFDNCTNFNKKYPHGVGRRGANDQGGDVTNFKRSTKIYKRAMRHNRDLDRDRDGIACEKA